MLSCVGNPKQIKVILISLGTSTKKKSKGNKKKQYKIMATLEQLKRNPRQEKKRRKKAGALERNPQKKGVCQKVFTKNPRKPNSALRKVCRVKLSNNAVVTAFIPGEGHNLQEHAVVLLRGGRTKDLPGIRYKVVRGVYDLKGLVSRTKSRSKYGAPKSK